MEFTDTDLRKILRRREFTDRLAKAITTTRETNTEAEFTYFSTGSNRTIWTPVFDFENAPLYEEEQDRLAIQSIGLLPHQNQSAGPYSIASRRFLGENGIDFLFTTPLITLHTHPKQSCHPSKADMRMIIGTQLNSLNAIKPIMAIATPMEYSFNEPEKNDSQVLLLQYKKNLAELYGDERFEPEFFMGEEERLKEREGNLIEGILEQYPDYRFGDNKTLTEIIQAFPNYSAALINYTPTKRGGLQPNPEDLRKVRGFGQKIKTLEKHLA